MAHPLPLPPICLGNHPERAPPSQSKPNLRALASKKGRSICRRQNLVRERAPGKPHGEGALRKEGWATDGDRCQEETSWRSGTQKPPSRASGLRQARLGRGRAGTRAVGDGGRWLMHRLLGVVHEAAVQLSKLPIGDVAAALLQVLQGTQEDLWSGPQVRGSRPPPPHPHTTEEAPTVSRSRRKRMLGTR